MREEKQTFVASLANPVSLIICPQILPLLAGLPRRETSESAGYETMAQITPAVYLHITFCNIECTHCCMYKTASKNTTKSTFGIIRDIMRYMTSIPRIPFCYGCV
jgi:hypothetical protein